MNTLIVPTDFSTTADNSLQYAVAFAKAYNFSVTLFHSVSFATIGSVNSLHPIEHGEQFLVDAEHSLREKIIQLKRDYPEVEFHQVAMVGSLMDNLLEVCQQLSPIAIIMGITGTNSSMDKIIGSNATTIAQELKYPVIIVPKGAEFKPIQTVTFACDLKNVVASTPLVSIRTFMKLFASKLHVLNVDYHNRNFTPRTPEEMHILDTMLDEVPHEFQFIEDEDVQHAINAFVEQHQIDMLIMIPKKHNLWDTIFKKSHTKEMAYHSHVPILSLHMD
jgi:nucleotide-binding universal stress UspA family protein